MFKNKIRFEEWEDDIILESVREYEGDKNKWRRVQLNLPHRTQRQIRERYRNFLHPDLIFTPWTDEERYTLLYLAGIYGRKWSLISQSLPHRSKVSIKNMYNTLERKSIYIRQFTLETYNEYE